MQKLQGRRSAKRRRTSPVPVELVLETSAVVGSPVSGNSSARLGRFGRDQCPGRVVRVC
jgi:hypothetical protein